MDNITDSECISSADVPCGCYLW